MQSVLRGPPRSCVSSEADTDPKDRVGCHWFATTAFGTEGSSAKHARAGVEGAEAKVAPVVKVHRPGMDGERLHVQAQPIAAEGHENGRAGQGGAWTGRRAMSMPSVNRHGGHSLSKLDVVPEELDGHCS